MSLCIVASCRSHGNPYAVLSHDWKITEGDASSENTDKLSFMKVGWPAVFAGNTPQMDLMGDVFYDHFASIKISDDDIELQLQAAREKFKRSLIDRDLQGKFGMGYEAFMGKGVKFFRPEEHREIVVQMQGALSECEMLVAGVIKDDVYLYQASEAYIVPINHFGTIGEGGDVASRWLHWRDQVESLSVEQTLLNVYEAQRFGSMANSVGRVLSMYVLNHRGILNQIRPSFKVKLEKHYQSVKHQKGISMSRDCFYAEPVEPDDVSPASQQVQGSTKRVRSTQQPSQE